MKKREKGQSLIELLAALAVVILSLLSLISVTTVSIRNATFSRNKSLAIKYAQEAIEQAREIRNENKTTFFEDLSDCNLPEQAISPPFKVKRVCSLEGTNKVRVEVTVNWEDAKGTHENVLTTYLAKW